MRRAALAEMTREQRAAALARVQANRAIEAVWEAALICSLAADTPDTIDALGAAQRSALGLAALLSATAPPGPDGHPIG